MPSAVVSRMAPSSSALAWPTAEGCGCTAEPARSRRRQRRSRLAAPEKISASAESPSHEIVYSRASVAGDGVCSSRPGSRKSSPACRCPRCCWRWRRRARHRARRGRRPLPAHAGSHSRSARETRGWRRAAGRAGRSGRRPAADRAASGRAGFRRAPAARSAISHAGCSLAGSGAFGAAGGSATASGAVGWRRALRARRVSLSSRADNCRASSLKALFSTGVRTGDFGFVRSGRNGRTFLGVSTGVSRSVGGEVSTAIGAGNQVQGSSRYRAIAQAGVRGGISDGQSRHACHGESAAVAAGGSLNNS